MIIGVLGAGQLGKMLALAGRRLGIDFVFYDEDPQACASGVGKIHTDWTAFAQAADLYTYEFEHVPLQLAQQLAQRDLLFPSLEALAITADRKQEKEFLASLGIETVNWRTVEHQAQLMEAAEQLGIPLLIKTRKFGYDGKGQWLIHHHHQLDKLASQLFVEGHPSYIAEKVVDIKRELSLIAVRAKNDNIVYYPPVENVHRDGILYTSQAPARLDDKTERKLQDWVAAIMKAWSYIGVMTLELFDTAQGFVANEIAPRVHNSGHWTIDGTSCCQFTNHIRAVSGLPLGEPQLRGYSMMWNLVGRVPDAKAQRQLLALPDSHLHLYGKQPRPGRKLGHWTLVRQDASYDPIPLTKDWQFFQSK